MSCKKSVNIRAIDRYAVKIQNVARMSLTKNNCVVVGCLLMI